LGAWTAAGFAGRRVGLAAIVALLVVTVTFFLVRILPGSPAALLAGPNASPEVVEGIERQLGLDQPLPSQYVQYVLDLARLDLGESIQTGNPVTADLRDRLPATLELLLFALLLGIAIGVPLGIYGAVRDRHLDGAIVRFFTVVGAALPEFWVGLVLIALLYAELGIVPAPFGRLGAETVPPPGVTGLYLVDALLTGELATFLDALAHVVVPASALAFVVLAPIARVTRATVRDVLAEDFVLAARANGDSGLRLLLGRVLPVASPPILTMLALVVGFLVAGGALVEKVFAWPGLGLYAVQAVRIGDFSALQGVVLVVALAYVLVFLLADVAGAILDPRSRVLER
jgi:ABC-type dipeptide/oligopeptide/nickel transport system permease component